MDAFVETEVTLSIVNPIATPQDFDSGVERFPPAKRPASLDGKTVVLLWNGKQNGQPALERARATLSQRYNDMRFIDVLGELGGAARYLSPKQVEFIKANADVAILTTADCGSCCSWLMRDMCELERAGVPSVALTAAIFGEDARFSTKTFGVPEAVPVIVPECFSNKTPDEVGAMVDGVMDAIVDGLTKDLKVIETFVPFEKLVLESAPEIHFLGSDLLDAFDNMQRKFVANGWSDGLPLVPPTRAKVEAMIEASGHDGDHVVGYFAPGMGIGTVRNIAANAVMAGCAPNTMPVILAMMECILDSSIGLRTWAMSTGPQAPAVLVSGAIADEIGMNRGICALGPGSISQVNVAIGRALRLVMMNVGLSYPGISDMDTIGTPAKFSFCVAENEERTPWAPWRVQRGFALEDSVVSVNVPYGMTELYDFKNSDPDLMIETWATITSGTCATPAQGGWLQRKNGPLHLGYPFHGEFANLLLMAPDHADVFAKAGWTPDDIKRAIHRASKLSFRKLMLNQEYDAFRASHPEALLWLEDAPESLVNVYPSPDCFEFFVVGASAGRSQHCFGGTNTVTRKVVRP